MAPIELVLTSVSQKSESYKLSGAPAGSGAGSCGVSAGTSSVGRAKQWLPRPAPDRPGGPAATSGCLPASLIPAQGRRPHLPILHLGASDLPPAEVRPRTLPGRAPPLPAASEERSEPFSVAETRARSAHGDTHVCGVLIHNSPPLKKRILTPAPRLWVPRPCPVRGGGRGHFQACFPSDHHFSVPIHWPEYSRPPCQPTSLDSIRHSVPTSINLNIFTRQTHRSTRMCPQHCHQHNRSVLTRKERKGKKD